MRLRKQEIIRIKKECRKYDMDWQEYDFEVQSYAEIMNDIHRKAGVQTPQMVEEELQRWESIAESYDRTRMEERIYIPEGINLDAQFINCLVLKFVPHNFGFAKEVLIAKFKGNFMNRTWKILEQNKTLHNTERYLWLMGPREITDMMLEELNKHNIRPYILRNSFLRRDFMHYYNGKIYLMSKAQFRGAIKPASVKVEREVGRIMARLFS